MDSLPLLVWFKPQPSDYETGAINPYLGEILQTKKVIPPGAAGDAPPLRGNIYVFLTYRVLDVLPVTSGDTRGKGVKDGSKG